MGLRTTLLLLLLVGGLVTLLLYTDQAVPQKTTSEIQALDGRQLGDCKRMRWQFPNNAPIEVSKDAAGRFRITEPIEDLAAVAYLRQIVNVWNSAQLVATDFLDDPKGRLETGLLTPELVLSVEWPDGKKLQLDVGTPGPVGSDRFVRRDGRIYRGGEGLYESMRVGLDDLRERAVFATQEPQCTELQVEQIQVTGKRETLHLQRQSSGEWRLLAPLQSRADQQKSIQFVTAVLQLRADHFPPGLVRYPDRQPEITVVVRGALGEESTRLWEAEGSVFGEIPGRGVAFTTENRSYASTFENAAQDLRATILLPFRDTANELAEVLLDPGQGRGDRTRVLRNTVAEDWRLLEPVEFKVGATPMNELVQAVNNLRVVEYVPGLTATDAATGLGVGRLQLSVRAIDTQDVVTLWLGADLQKNDVPLTYACRADDPGSVVLVPGPAVAQLRRAWPTYCNLDVLRLGVPIERLELRRGKVARTFRLQGVHWEVEGTPGNRDEVGGFANDTLRDLRGKAAVDLRGTAYGEPDWILDLCRENGDVLMALRIWDRSKEAPLVVQPCAPQQQPGPIGFEVAPQVAKALREFWQ